MEPCADPQLESTSTRSSPPDLAGNPKAGSGETMKDVYECRICGYQAHGVKGLSQHLHASHPVTSLSDKPEGPALEEEEEESLGADGDSGQSSVKAHVSECAPLETPEDSTETFSSTEAPDQDERMETSPASKASQSSSPPCRVETSPCSSGPKQSLHKKQTVSSGTSNQNQTNLVCLPLVSEGLKLIWVRSEQINELDSVSDLVEAFNAFPYPTSQEASALARKCALPPDRVKAWFMMQRVRYGISWGDDDIRETRHKLWRFQNRTAPVDCLDMDDDEDELQDYLRHESERLAESRPSPPESHRLPRPKPVLTAFQGHASFGQNNASQLNNGSSVRRHYDQVEERTVPPPRSSVQIDPSCVIINDQQEPDYHSDSDPFPEISKSIHSYPGKKSKAQLLALRRSFVRKAWPSDGEVQRLQRSTGLNRRDIRKWFADSRYQLRKNGRAWLVKLVRHNRTLQAFQQNQLEMDTPPGFTSGTDNTEVDFDLDNMPEDDPVQASEIIEEISDGGEGEDLKPPAPAVDVSPSPTPSTYPCGRVEPNVRLRKKTREQLEVLRQSFLSCPWPTSDDYMLLQQKTGLTRTEIIQWYGDTRYHVKHNQMRWMTSEERDRIVVLITKQQRRGSKGGRRAVLESLDPELSLVDSTLVNGGEAGQPLEWSELFGAPVVPKGAL